ncbi:MAG TPA: pilus assembly protein PilM [Haliangium sp.]|nr:pilus assembly protein PilM [Haliangium sp.]
MASRILGIDLGTYSVKVLVAAPGFRQLTPLELIERRLPAPATDGEHPWERAARVLGDLAREHKLGSETAYVATGGDQLFIHVLELAFRNLRRPDLEKAVGAELEGVLPVELEDMVYGFESLPPLEPRGGALPEPAGPTAEPAADDEEPTAVRGGAASGAPSAATGAGRVAPPTEGMRVLACAMEIARARHLIELLGEQGLEPRAVVAAPAAYAAMAERIEASTAPGEPAFTAVAGPVVVIDMGHTRTQVCVVAGGKPVYARSIPRGGREVTEAIARAWNLPREQAEQVKHESGFVASALAPAGSDQQQQMHDVVAREVTALARELRRTVQSCRAKTGATPTRAVLVGGASRLAGMSPFLSEFLGMPASRLGVDSARLLLGEKLASVGAPADTACVAAGLALECAAGRPRFDLRQGELIYKADLSFLREKAPALMAAVVILLAFLTFDGFAELYKLRRAEAALATRLALETTAAFGEQLSASAAMDRVGGKTTVKKSPLPRMTAYDILLELNNKLPDRSNVTLDVEKLDIRQGKITFEATAKTSPEIDAVEEALSKVECFKEISRGSTSVGQDDVRKFSFTITTNCM